MDSPHFWSPSLGYHFLQLLGSSRKPNNVPELPWLRDTNKSTRSELIHTQMDRTASQNIYQTTISVKVINNTTTNNMKLRNTYWTQNNLDRSWLWVLLPFPFAIESIQFRCTYATRFKDARQHTLRDFDSTKWKEMKFLPRGWSHQLSVVGYLWLSPSGPKFLG